MKILKQELFRGNEKNYFIVDVRAPIQHHTKHIEGAVNIPLADIMDKTDLIPKDRVILCYCNGGTSGGIAANILEEKGYDVYSLEGGIKKYLGIEE